MPNQYIKEWAEACMYAKECLPPFMYDLGREPWTMLFGIAIACIIIWAWNEKSP